MTRIGLTGFNTASGLGVVNRQLCDHLPLTSWLVTQHKCFHTLPSSSIRERTEQVNDLSSFLRSIDVLLFVENPLKINLRPIKEEGKRIVCVMMQEWMPADLEDWPKYVDLFICPTSHAFNQFKDRLPCKYFPWPVDTDQFPFTQKTECERFLFINGHGGWKGRKGGDVVRRAKQLWPEMPLTVYSQSGSNNWPAGTDVRGRVKTPSNLYAAGDVLLCPHKADGIGLELLEAASSGLPLVATDGDPWNELPLLRKIPATLTRRVIKRQVDWYEPSPEGLVTICKDLLCLPIIQDSLSIRRWAQNRSWAASYSSFQKMVEGV